jgi:hypothetical protein
MKFRSGVRYNVDSRDWKCEFAKDTKVDRYPTKMIMDTGRYTHRWEGYTDTIWLIK